MCLYELASSFEAEYTSYSLMAVILAGKVPNQYRQYEFHMGPHCEPRQGCLTVEAFPSHELFTDESLYFECIMKHNQPRVVTMGTDL